MFTLNATLALVLLLRSVTAFHQQAPRIRTIIPPKNWSDQEKQCGTSSHHFALPSNNSNNDANKDQGTISKTQLSASVMGARIPTSPFQIFCDLDGVLCDFDAGVRSLSQGIAANNLPTRKMWQLVHAADRFYERLAWTKDGQRLWNSIRDYQPNILTGVSKRIGCPEEKAQWCRRELGVETNHVHKADQRSRHNLVKGEPKDGVVNVITCWSRNKHFESGHRAVLIDDREALAADWVAKGGIFIHHTDTEQTLKQLREHGIIDYHDDEAYSI